MRLKALMRYNKCAQMNQEILSNKIYLNLFKSKNRDLEEEFEKIENELIEKNKDKNEK